MRDHREQRTEGDAGRTSPASGEWKKHLPQAREYPITKHAKQLVLEQDFLRLDLAEPVLRDVLRDGVARRVLWTQGEREVGSVTLRVVLQPVSEQRALRIECSTPSARAQTQSVMLTTTTPPFGGTRNWFVAPCGRTVRVLYAPIRSNTGFKCAKCSPGAYLSQRDWWRPSYRFGVRAERRLRRAERRLARGGTSAVLDAKVDLLEARRLKGQQIESATASVDELAKRLVELQGRTRA